MDNVEKAKQMFLSYSCSYYSMTREGVMEEYRALGVSPSMERTWAMELGFNLLRHFSDVLVDDTELSFMFRLISDYKLFSLLEAFNYSLERNIDALDTFTKILVGEDLMRVESRLRPTGGTDFAILIATRTNIENIVRRIGDERITISAYYRKVGYFNEMLDDKSIQDRIRVLREQVILKSWGKQRDG